jgi:hypothetical protein
LSRLDRSIELEFLGVFHCNDIKARASKYRAQGARIVDGLYQRGLGVGVVTVANQQGYPGYLAGRTIDLTCSYGHFYAALRSVNLRIPAKAQGYRGDQHESCDCQNTNGSFTLQSEHGILLWCGTNQSLVRPFFTTSDFLGIACGGLRAFSMSRHPSPSENLWVSR